ncbi:hypothetical protein VNO77_25520 [Canavalia gladiata]|uniref:Uncharacterized protein n=1 Tax=Canavalia gladiata TaxID=3824 RepID=A0AAN9LDF1_CANGL
MRCTPKCKFIDTNDSLYIHSFKKDPNLESIIALVYMKASTFFPIQEYGQEALGTKKLMWEGRGSVGTKAQLQNPASSAKNVLIPITNQEILILTPSPTNSP